MPRRYLSSADWRSHTIEGRMQGETMKQAALFLALAAVAALPAYAQEELAKKHNCLACHATDKKLVGPSYKEVAAKYRNDPAAEADRKSTRLNSSHGYISYAVFCLKKKKKQPKHNKPLQKQNNH